MTLGVMGNEARDQLCLIYGAKRGLRDGAIGSKVTTRPSREKVN